MILKKLTFTLLLLCPALPLAQTPAPTDTAKAKSPNDSTILQDTLNPSWPGPDDLSGADKRSTDIHKRLKEFQESEKPPARFSFYDSLLTYLVSERFNQRSQIMQSFFHDAGDYFKFDPGFFVVDYQSTPMRKTVQPFGLTGDRLNVISNGIPFTPFEHVVEPDGMIDLNDVPTALDGPVFIIPGPMGQLFGGGSSLATLLTVAAIADSNQPASSFMADKGFFGYAFVRGRYTRQFSNGRKIELSASSRKSDGLELGRDDEQLHYTAAIFFPIQAKFGFKLDAKMYDREGALAVRPDSGGVLLRRDRFDRSLCASFELQNDQRSARNEIGYRHLRQGSNLDNIYRGTFNNTVNGLFLTHEQMLGSKIIKAEVAVDFTEYDNSKLFNRFNSSLALSLTRLKKIHNLTIQAKAGYSDGYDFLPSGTIIYQSDFEKLFIRLAAGYSQKEPSLHQLNLSFRQVALYGAATQEYSESGNSNLKKESQLIGSLTIEPGTIDNNLSLNVTGGKINDAIEWSSEIIGSVITVRHFAPVNDNITFVSASVRPRFRISDVVRFNAGAAWHKYDYDSLGARPYQPDYNGFTGLELHYFWKDRLVDLLAYGEIVYAGPYLGINNKQLGKELVANAKLSLGLRNFRFHFVFQNTFDNVYEARQEMTIPGRFFYYGLVWNFFD